MGGGHLEMVSFCEGVGDLTEADAVSVSGKEEVASYRVGGASDDVRPTRMSCP
jgi:hypothetical protein